MEADWCRPRCDHPGLSVAKRRAVLSSSARENGAFTSPSRLEHQPVPDDDPTRILAGDAPTVARTLLGWSLTSEAVTIRLTEVEAYAGVGADPASHAHRGRTARNATMFGGPGLAYVYFVFGMHWCLNVVCGPPGTAAAVLLRAGEVTRGRAAARARRDAGPSGAGRRPDSGRRGRHVPDRDLARGPARLTRALGIDGHADGTRLLDGSGPVVLAPPAGPVPDAAVRSGPRVGVAAAADVPWRFWLPAESSVSAYRRHRAPR
ncbi:MAG: DNA-3-methyladenine glycosylase [Dactylosporangium sp.]|nr:DNA-3-methyladenine glycosylase [Dactylosporangium sp.]NNJ63284.1 DNA-3-methyladenine glycosylase [Dactylosporangium sp.]